MLNSTTAPVLETTTFLDRLTRANDQKAPTTGPAAVNFKKRPRRDSNDEANNTTGSTSTIPRSITQEEADTSTIPIPTNLISPDTLVYIGLRPEIAHVCWTSWLASPPDNLGHLDDKAAHFLQRALLYIEQAGPDVAGKGADWSGWYAALDGYGLDEETVDLIMDPDYDAVRLSRSAMYWAVDTLQAKFWELVENLERPGESTRRLQPKKKTKPSL